MDIANRLARARRLTGMTLQGVKEKTRIAESTLSDFENGKKEPRFSQLSVLAKVYHKKIDYFLTDGEVSDPSILWRNEPETGTELIEAQFRELCENYHRLENVCGSRQPVRLKKHISQSEISVESVTNIADETRRALGLGDRPGREIARVLEEYAGVKIFYIRNKIDGTAACSWGEFGPAIFLDPNNVRWRRNFSIAHELFHLITWDVFPKKDDLTFVATRSEETLANKFAANLLMPEKALVESINDKLDGGKLRLEHLVDIAREFDVSHSALLIQLKNIYKLSDEQFTKLETWAEENIHLFRDRNPERLAEQMGLPERYIELAHKALRKGKISVGMFGKYMYISRYEATRIAQKETSIDEEIFLSNN